MSLPYYKKYSKDFLEGTAHMSGELKGAYSVLLDLIYVQNGQCPDNAHYVSGNLGYSVRKWNSIKKELIKLGKIEVKNGIISNKRADKEVLILSKYQDKQAENRRECNKNNDLQKPPLTLINNTEPEPEPIEKNIQKRFEEFWEVFADKRGKEGALRVWNRKHLERKADEVIRGARAYVKIRGDDKKFWKQAQGWLNDGRWSDENIKPKPKVERTVFGDIPDNTFMSPEEIQRKAGMIQ